MEQAINQFVGGLLMDTNPMMLENTTLSDALNATIVTMNGNELILQNDMGNRKIDHAYLPPGYEPVGIKEYGGVIYIACYNPITNKGLVGSFPSPERRMEEPSIDSTPSNLDSLFDIDWENNLKSDTILIPLIKDYVLHAGDKFVIYDNNITLYKDEISNYNNVRLLDGSDQKSHLVYSPKNKTYTLSIGVLNSQNEFMDITKNLCRWDENNKIINYTKESDLYKFNDGYFIPSSWTNPNLGEAEDDYNLIKNRQIIDANTYSYKLVGPLYLKVQLNHFLDFSYNIYADKDVDVYGEQLIKFYIESTVVYNCPDYGTSQETISTDKYENLELIREPENGKWFDFTLTPISINAIDDWKENLLNLNVSPNEFKAEPTLYIGNEVAPIAPEQPTINSNPYDVTPGRENDGEVSNEVDSSQKYQIFSSYDEETNLYTLKFVLTYTYNYILNKKLHYKIKPFVQWKNHTTNEYNKGYIKELIGEGNIDLSKLGTNTVDVTEWRFYNYSDSTKLIYSFEAYPKFGKKFETLNLEFYKCSASGVSTTPDFKIENLEFRNGRSTLNFNWSEYRILPRELYKVKIKVVGADENLNLERWFLSTELMNDCFNSISDYGDRENATVLDKLTIKFESNYSKNVDIQYGTTSQELDSNYNHSLINNNNRGIKLYYEHIGSIDYNINESLKIANQDLYPSFISISNFNISDIRVNNTIDPPDINYNSSENLSSEYSLNNFTDWINIQTNTNTTNRTSKVIISYKDVFLGGVTNSGIINFPFKSIDTCLSKAIYGSVDEHCHGGIAIGWKPRSGKGDYHTLLIVGPHTQPSFRISGLSDGVEVNLKEINSSECSEVKYVEIANEHLDHHKVYKISDFIAVLNDNFNTKFGNHTFVYYYNNIRNNSDDNIYNGCSNSYETDECNAIAKIQNRPNSWHESGWKNYVFNKINEDEALKANRLPFKNYARLWWRTINGNWALVDAPICRNGSLNAEEGTDDPGSNGTALINYIKKRLFNNKNIYYCYTNVEPLNESNIYKADNIDYIYNDIYQFNVKTTINIDYDNINIIGINLEDSLFTYNTTSAIQIEETNSFKSSSSFSDVVNNIISSNNISNVALISNGSPIFFDDNDQILNQQSFYSFLDGKLHKESFPYKVAEGFNGYNTILYNENIGNSGKLDFRYDVGGGDDNDNWTILDYDSGIPIVKTYK